MIRRRGMTLLEILISVAILVVVVAMAMTLLMQGVFFSRRGQELADANDAARAGGQVVVAALQNAGLGMGNGLLVLDGSGTPFIANAVMVVNHDDKPDELWVVRPHRRALLESCVDEGAGTTVQRTGFGTIFARCAIKGWNNPSPQSLSGSSADLLLAVTNLKQAALLTGGAFAANGLGVDLTFNESGTANFADDRTAGFHQGDLVMPVRIEHYFVGPSGSGSTALMMEPGTVGATFPTAKGDARVVQDDIEDFQLAVGIDNTSSGNPNNIAFSSAGLGAAFQPGVRSVRVSVVARSPMAILNTNGSISTSADYAPLSVEDHLIGTPTADGHRRTLFTRRVELVNFAAGDL